MDLTQAAVIAAISAVVSFAASMLGLGGAVLLIPAYLYLPQAFGADPLPVPLVTGMTSIQVLTTSLLSVALHHRKGVVERRIVLAMGIPIVISSFLGALGSARVEPHAIVIVFSLMAILGAALLVARREEPEHYSARTDFRPLPAGLIAFGVGAFGGIVGAPGAFLLSPLMMTVLRIPTRITIGSTLGIVLMAALSTSAGKLLAGHVRWDLAAAAVAGAIPGAVAGASLSHRLRVGTLRAILAVLIAGVGIVMFLEAVGLLHSS